MGKRRRRRSSVTECEGRGGARARVRQGVGERKAVATNISYRASGFVQLRIIPPKIVPCGLVSRGKRVRRMAGSV